MTSIIKQDLKTIVSTDLVPWKALAGSTVLIAGANGMLASYMVETLLYLNQTRFSRTPIRVLALSRSEDKVKQRFRHYLAREDFHLIIQNVCQPLVYHHPVDFIIHAASQASPKYYGFDPVGTLEANVIGTRNLLALARSKKVSSFLFISSSEVYGNLNEPIVESDYGKLDPTQVRSCGAESKRMGETMCVAWHHQHRVPAKIVRPFHTYAPTMRLDDSRVFADFVASIVNQKNIVLNSDGSAQRSFCYVTDATIAFFLILLTGAEAEAYNLGNPDQTISVLDLAHLLVGLFPEKGLRVIKNVSEERPGYLPSAVNRNIPDIGKLKQLGWQPKVAITEGFRRVIEHYHNLPTALRQRHFSTI